MAATKAEKESILSSLRGRIPIFSLDSLSPDEINVLSQITGGAPPDEGLGYIERTGKLPQWVKDKIGTHQSGLIQSQILSKLPNRAEAIRKYLKEQPSDVTQMDEGQILERLKVYDELKSTKGPGAKIPQPDLFTNAIRARVGERLKGMGIGITGDTEHQISQYVATQIMTGTENAQALGEFVQAQTGASRAAAREVIEKAPDIYAEFRPRFLQGEFSIQQPDVDFGGDVSGDISKLQGALKPLTKKRKAEEAVTAFLSNLDVENKASADELAKSLYGYQQQFFTEKLQPQIEAQLNARGLLQSGSLAEAFGRSAKELAGQTTATLAPYIAGNQQGAQKLKYENILRQALESGRDIESATAFARQLFAGEQAGGRQMAQSDLERSYQQQQNDQNRAFQLALAGSQNRGGPGALDYFLSTLPVIGQLGSAYVGGRMAQNKPIWSWK